MREVRKQALVPHSAQTMFDLVNDVDAYPEFLPWCRDARVKEEGDGFRVASIDIALAGAHKTFTTRNTLEPPERLTIDLVEGPFRHLTGEWVFDSLGEDACKVSLCLKFEFSSSIMSMMFGPVFKQMGDTMLEAFVRRAKTLYGNR
ncbi:MAG TPA: type II toxin-antitoxin system RatA family toxin [Gammaproteobacteria bacterium]